MISIGAFAECDGLEAVVMLRETPPTLIYSVGMAWIQFPNVKTITVPKGSGNAYKTADGWKNYVNQIVEAE